MRFSALLFATCVVTAAATDEANWNQLMAKVVVCRAIDVEADCNIATADGLADCDWHDGKQECEVSNTKVTEFMPVMGWEMYSCAQHTAVTDCTPTGSSADPCEWKDGGWCEMAEHMWLIYAPEVSYDCPSGSAFQFDVTKASPVIGMTCGQAAALLPVVEGDDLGRFQYALTECCDGPPTYACPSENGEHASFDEGRHVGYHCTDEGDIDDQGECEAAGYVWEEQYCSTFAQYKAMADHPAIDMTQHMPGIMQTLAMCCEDNAGTATTATPVSGGCGADLCGHGTTWNHEKSQCVATFTGCLDKCKLKRGRFAWTCDKVDAACSAGGGGSGDCHGIAGWYQTATCACPADHGSAMDMTYCYPAAAAGRDPVGHIVCASAKICSSATQNDRCIKGGAYMDLYPKDEANRWVIRRVSSADGGTYNFQVEGMSTTMYLGVDGGVYSGCVNNMFSNDDRFAEDSEVLDFTIDEQCHIKWNGNFVSSLFCTDAESCKDDGGGLCAVGDDRHDDTWTFYCTSAESAAETSIPQLCFA